MDQLPPPPPPPSGGGSGGGGQKRKRPESPVAEDSSKVPRTQGPQQANLFTANTQGQQGHLGGHHGFPGPADSCIYNPVMGLWTHPLPQPLPVQVRLLQQAMNQQFQSRMQMATAATASVGGQGQQQFAHLNRQTPAPAFRQTQQAPLGTTFFPSHMLSLLDQLYHREFGHRAPVPGTPLVLYTRAARLLGPQEYFNSLIARGILVPPPPPTTTTTTATTADGRAANQEEQAPRPVSDRADTDTRPLGSVSGDPPRRSNVGTDAPAPSTGNGQGRDPVASWMAAHARSRRARAQADNGNQGQATSPLHDQQAREHTEPARAAEQQPEPVTAAGAEASRENEEAESGEDEEGHDLNNNVRSFSGPDDPSFLVPNLVYGLYPSLPRSGGGSSDGDTRGQGPLPARGNDGWEALLDAANDAYAETVLEGVQHGGWADVNTGQLTFARNLLRRGAQTPNERALAELLAAMPMTTHEEAADQVQNEEATVGSETEVGPASTAAADKDDDETIDGGED